MKVNVRTDLSDFRKYMDKAKKFPHFNQSMKMLADRATVQLKAYTPKDSGKTSEGWTPTYIRGKDGRIRQVLIHNRDNDQELLLWLEEGTKAHVIKVGEKGFLAFKTEDGTWIFTKRDIHHQGTKAYRMVKKTTILLQGQLKQFTSLYEQTFNRYLNT